MKARITVTVTRIVDLSEDYYDSDSTVDERLRDEIQYADNLFHEWIEGNGVEFKTEGSLIEDFESTETA